MFLESLDALSFSLITLSCLLAKIELPEVKIIHVVSVFTWFSKLEGRTYQMAKNISIILKTREVENGNFLFIFEAFEGWEFK